MSFWAESFSFNGQSCTDYDLMLYELGNGDSEETEFASTTAISDDFVGGRWRPLFYGVKYQNKLTFEMTFGVNQCRLDQEQYLSRDEIDAIATWLTRVEQYCWLTIDQDDMADYRYKCMISGIRLVSYGKIPYALRVTVTCDSPFAYHLPEEKTVSIRGSTSIVLNNKSSANGYYYPKIEYTRTSTGYSTFSVSVSGDNGRTFTINNIPNSITQISIDCENCIITDNQDINLYDKCNYLWPRLLPGNNTITFYGYGTVKITCEFPANIGG